MTKRKVLLCAAVLAAAGVAVLFMRPSDTAMSEPAAAGASSTSMLPAVAAATPKPSGCPAVSCTNQTPTMRGTLPYVLTSAKPFDKSLRLAAESLGAKTVSVVSRNALLVEADEATRVKLSGDGRFEEVAEFVPSSKIQPELAAMIASGAKSVDVSLVALAAEDREIVISCLEYGGGEMLKGCINEGDTIRAKLPADLVATLATRGDVRWMEKFEYPRLMNDVAVKPQAMNVREVWDTHGLTGAGQIISTSDSGIDTGDLETMHRDLRNRVKGIKVVEGCVSTDVNGHGTHTAGSIVGDGTESDGQIRGTAHEADLYAWFCSKGDSGVYTPTTMSALYTADGEWNAHIHSASWGGATGGEYDSRCANHDAYVWNNPEFLPVFSAGNEGSVRYTIGSPAAAKNVLTVGATQNLRSGHDGDSGNGDPTNTAEYSSRGPCQDGRIKPDIAAPGTGVLSTRSHGVDYSYGIYNEFYAYDTGTSMACPLTAGAVALVRQWLVEKKGFADEDGKRPTAALMKAVVMGGAKGADVPNNDQGWGRVDLEETLFPSNRAVKLIDRIPFEQGFVTNIVIETTNAAPFDVQLVWVDYPGSAIGSQSVPRLVNDIDLSVSARIPGEPTVRHGNGGDEPDTLNNAESVRIANAQPTKYVITVDCKTILHDYKEGGAAALYIRGAFDSDAESEKPAYVHLKKQNRNFMSLDRALEAVRDDGETVEILDWVNLDKPVTLTNDCTIVATNENAAAAYVARSDGALLTVATNATVTLSNVVFAASTEKVVAVENGGCLKLSDKADLGIDYDHIAVSTVTTNGLDLAGTLTGPTVIHCDEATSTGDVFGTYSCDKTVAMACADWLICADDIDHELRGGVDPNGTLIWKRTTSFPVGESAGYFVDNEGNTNAYYRMEKALAKFWDGYREGRASEFIARRDGAFGLSFCGGDKVDSPLVFRGDGEPKPVLTATAASHFEVADGGSLVISNIAFRGSAPNDETSEICFIKVDGGELTLDDGAELNGIIGRVDYGSGVVELNSGTVTMKEGASIINCSAEGLTTGTGYGGAIYVKGMGCQLNLWGGVMTNCFASSLGGGVYTYVFGGAAEINVKGDLTIADNASNGYANDDIYLRIAKGLSGLKVTGAVNGRVGVRYASSIAGNEVGASFITNAIEGDVDETTLRSFFSDALGEGYIAAVGTGDKVGTLVWAADTRDKRQCDEGDASAKLVAGDKTTFWWDVSDALNAATDGSIVEVLKDYTLTNSVGVSGRVTLRTVETEAAALSLVRAKDVSLSITNGSVLTVTNMNFNGNNSDGESCTPLFNVSGGALKIDGVTIQDVTGGTNRNANAITVKDGTFEMRNSQITNCRNDAIDPSGAPEKTVNAGVGGGVLVDHATAYLLGGSIANCRAAKGGGVFACNGSTVYVGGDMRITENATNGVPNNLVVADSSSLILADALTEAIHVSPHLDYSLAHPGDTNVVAEVGYDWDVTSLTNSAAKFERDIDGELAVAVTNSTKALIVWCGAVKDGVYTNVSDGVEYVLAGEMPVAAPPVSGYQLTFGTENAFADDPVVEITNMANAADGIKVTVLVKDGDTPVAVDADKVAALFEATGDIGDWSKTVDLTVENPVQNADKSVTFEVRPAGEPSNVFIRLKY